MSKHSPASHNTASFISLGEAAAEVVAKLRTVEVKDPLVNVGEHDASDEPPTDLINPTCEVRADLCQPLKQASRDQHDEDFANQSHQDTSPAGRETSAAVARNGLVSPP